MLTTLTAQTYDDGEQPRLGALIRTVSGEEFYLCNPYDEVRIAIADGEAFEAHKVLGGHPRRVMLNPRQIESATEVDD